VALPGGMAVQIVDCAGARLSMINSDTIAAFRVGLRAPGFWVFVGGLCVGWEAGGAGQLTLQAHAPASHAHWNAAGGRARTDLATSIRRCLRRSACTTPSAWQRPSSSTRRGGSTCPGGRLVFRLHYLLRSRRTGGFRRAPLRFLVATAAGTGPSGPAADAGFGCWGLGLRRVFEGDDWSFDGTRARRQPERPVVGPLRRVRPCCAARPPPETLLHPHPLQNPVSFPSTGASPRAYWTRTLAPRRGPRARAAIWGGGAGRAAARPAAGRALPLGSAGRPPRRRPGASARRLAPDS
jgi:hypothetical protein